MEDGPFIIEWPERIRAALPDDHLWIDLTWQDDEQRGLIFNPTGKRFKKLMVTLKKEMIKSF
jgi:tRNA A37 threonylcarbamoyladenosine biosynthesis protein TsaE